MNVILGLDEEEVVWLDRMVDAVGGAPDGACGGGGGGARSTSHWSDVMGMLKGLVCHWQKMPYGFSVGK
jgi:hypothetical protein